MCSCGELKSRIYIEWVNKLNDTITNRLVTGDYKNKDESMQLAIIRVTTDKGLTLYHTRKGLSENFEQATKFKTINHGLRVARKKYYRLLGNGLNRIESSTLN